MFYVFNIASVFMGKNCLENLHSIKNTGKDLTMKQMFDISEKLIAGQSDEFFREYNQLGWFFMETFTFGDEEVISLQRTTVYVFSDSVLCLGKIHENPQSNTAWEDRLTWFKTSHNTDLWTQLMVSQRNSSGISSQGSPHCSSVDEFSTHFKSLRRCEDLNGFRVSRTNDDSWWQWSHFPRNNWVWVATIGDPISGFEVFKHRCANHCCLLENTRQRVDHCVAWWQRLHVPQRFECCKKKKRCLGPEGVERFSTPRLYSCAQRKQRVQHLRETNRKQDWCDATVWRFRIGEFPGGAHDRMRNDVDGDEAMVPRVPNLPPEPSERQIAERVLRDMQCAEAGVVIALRRRVLPEIGIYYGFFAESTSRRWWSGSFLENKGKSSESIPTICSLVWQSMESMFGSRRRSKKKIPALYWCFRNNCLFLSSSRTFRTLLHCRTRLWFRSNSSNMFTILDVDSIFILSSTLD